jgi:uncharacterized membrane protein
MVERIEKSIEVRAPLSTVYNQWTQFEEFPQFMQGVEKVKQLDDRRLHWVADIGFVEREWDAEIVRQEPDEVIAWRAMGDVSNDGTVMFTPSSAGDTRVTLVMEYEPEGFMEKLGDKMGVIEKRVEGDLKRFKEFIESRGAETGGWRGEIG